MPTRLLLMVLLALGCSSPEQGSTTPRTPPPEPASEPEPAEPSEEESTATAEAAPGFDTTAWEALLDAYVTNDGGFRYAALRGREADVARLAEVVEAVGAASPDGWSRDAQLAFYLNAYNVLTVNSVLSHWPLEGVMTVDGFFDEETHRVAGVDRTLNALENEIIRDRERFGEPRIHFGVNCASVGCPWLSGDAFTAANLEAQLAALSQSFVRRTTRLEGGALHVSQIFEWFAADFAPDGVRAFLAARLEGELADSARDEGTALSFDEYDWALNARP
ncbi:MAG: DUF547 domain-containing protein [Sandaracinaceae bacterium]